MTNRFVPNPVFEEELKRSTLLLDDVKEVADKIAARQLELSPEADGDYKAGIVTEAGMEDGVATGRVNNNDWKSVFIEFGTADHPFGAPLRKAIESLGLRLEGGDR